MGLDAFRLGRVIPSNLQKWSDFNSDPLENFYKKLIMPLYLFLSRNVGKLLRCFCDIDAELFPEILEQAL